jgi:hypothetical protein
MLRLRVPLAPPEGSHEPGCLPAKLRWDAPISRRRFLYTSSLAFAVLASPLTLATRTFAARRGRFLTGTELRTLEALCDRILPPDDDPGAKSLGAAHYIDSFLNAFERRKARIFAGGPFSNRNPYPDANRGRPSRRRPKNNFNDFIPLTHLQELRWRAELYGSSTVPEFAPIDAQHGTILPGLRDIYRAALARIDEIARAVAGAPFAKLDTAEQDRVFTMLDDGAFAPDPRRGNRTFVDLLIQHTLEGCFAAPEYGGNRRARGWRMIGLEGDSQPLGFSIYSSAIDGYVEREDHPMSGPNPDEIDAPRPLTPDGLKVQESIATLAGIFGDGTC